MKFHRPRLLTVPLALMLALSIVAPVAAARPVVGPISATPSSLRFRSGYADFTETVVVVFTNNTSEQMSLVGTGIDQTYNDFRVTDLAADCRSLEPLDPGESCSFGVYFWPQNSGRQLATLWLHGQTANIDFTASVPIVGRASRPVR